MIFFHKPYYNFNKTNLNKKILVIYAINPKNYTKHKKYIMQIFKKKECKKKFKNQNLKLLNYKDLFTKKNFNLLKKSNKFCKNQKKKYVSYLCVISLNYFFHYF